MLTHKEDPLMVVGNQVVKIPGKEVERTEDEMKSLMYDGLLNGLSDTQKEALLNYILSLKD